MCNLCIQQSETASIAKETTNSPCLLVSVLQTTTKLLGRNNLLQLRTLNYPGFVEDYGIQHLISNKEKETCIAKSTVRLKVKSAQALNCSTFPKCSKFHVSIFKHVKEHHEAQLSQYKEKHKPAHKPKARSNEGVPR